MGERQRGRARRAGGARPPAYLQRDRRSAYVFVAPQFIGVVLFLGLPTVLVFWFSLFDWNLLRGTSTFAGSGNYERMLSDPLFAEVLRNTAIFTAGLVPASMLLALVLALLVNQRLPGSTLFRTLFFAPVVVSLVAWAIVWSFLFQSDGGINLVLATIGIDGPNWLRDSNWVMPAVIAVQVFKGVGMNMVLFLAALQTVPSVLTEAAKVDGAGPFSVFRWVTLPMIAPTTLLVSIITIIGAFQVFTTITVLTAGGPGNSTNVLVYYVYQQAFQRFEAGYASAAAVVLFVIVLLLTLLQWKLRKKWVFHERD